MRSAGDIFMQNSFCSRRNARAAFRKGPTTGVKTRKGQHVDVGHKMAPTITGCVKVNPAPIKAKRVPCVNLPLRLPET